MSDASRITHTCTCAEAQRRCKCHASRTPALAPKRSAGASVTFHAEWVAFVVVVLLAAFFRFYALDSIPPGLHYDEAIDAHLAQDIRAGARPVYFVQGWGREPLYHYLVALAMNWLSPAMALRATSATLGTLFVALAFLLLRELFDWRVAAVGSAWLACSFWVMSVSRLGVRDVAVQPLAVGAMLAMWQGAKRKSQGARIAAGGALLGLSFYTYQASRAMPLLIVSFIAYLAIFHREQLARQWKGLVVFVVMAAVIVAPLVTYLATHPGAESGRSFQSEPIQQLLQGKPGPMFDHTLATLKMFSFYGDPQPLYNVPGRPALTSIAGLMFYAGLVIALARFKRNEYAFVLLWLVASLAPALVTYPAPHLPRTLLAQLPVAALIALAVVAIGDGAKSVLRLAERSFVLPLLAILVVGQTAWQTGNDYFVTWANLPQVRFQYNAGPAAAARYLDASPDTDPVVLAGLFADDSDPYNFAVMLNRRDLDLRWFDAASALPVPVGARTMRVILYDFTPVDEMIRARYLASATLLTEQPGVFLVYRLDADTLRADLERPQADAPASFGNVSLLGYDISSRRVAPGNTLALITRWRVTNVGAPQPVAIFAHLVDASGKPVAQDDRLGYPHHGWQPGDEFAQVHRFAIPAQAKPGAHSLKLGVYFRDTGARWPAAGGDSVSLGQVEVINGQ